MSDTLSVMIETTDGRQFFFKKTNLKSINALAHAIKAKIFIVKTNTKNINTIEENIKFICDQSHITSKNLFTIIKDPNMKTTKLPDKKIREIIKENFIKNKKISFKEIQYIFRKHNISASSLNQKFTQTRLDLSVLGYQIEKIKNGLYAIKNA
jgi:sulfatase maturation enzyme AslB (radical SAM superfamily)